MITPENACMLKLLADSLHEEHAHRDRTTNRVPPGLWEKVYKELMAQSVFALPASQIDATFFPAYSFAVGKNLQFFYTVMEEQQELLSLLSSHAIPVVVLKGAAAAMNYPQPEYRCMGDIDIIVQPDDFIRTYEVMCNAGYKAEQTLEDYVRHIGFHSSLGIEIELHHYFSTSNNKKQNKVLDDYIYHAIPHSVTANVCGYAVPVLPTLENGLVLLAHINQHLRSGLGLRQIIDWMCYVENYLEDDCWFTSFSNAAEQIGMRQLAIITTAMCRKYLGMKKDISWCGEISDTSICDEFMEYILSHGNFGQIDSTKATTVSVIRMFRNPIHGLKKAQKAGCHTWKALKKHPWLRPFAWVYQLIRWISHGRKRGVNLTYVNRASQTESVETDFLRRLGVTRI